MPKNTCYFSEGSVAIPDGYLERTINTLIDTKSQHPPVTISRDSLGNHNGIEEYIDSQLAILKKQVQDWQQEANIDITLGENTTVGILLSYNFMRPDNSRFYQKQAIFTLDMEQVLIFSMSKPSPVTEEDSQHFSAMLTSFSPQ